MKAIILAAGRGERMRPLTDETPKPLLVAGGRSLIEWQIMRLVRAGVTELVVNVSHLAEQIERSLGDGARYGARITYSHEHTALETAGGIVQALPLLGAEPFIAVNADIYCDFDYAQIGPAVAALACNASRWRAYLVLVNNPEHHAHGDFGLQGHQVVAATAASRWTFSGIGIYRPELFLGIAPGERRPLGPLLHARVAAGEVFAEHYPGIWLDVGTPGRLARLRSMLAADV